MLFDGGRCRRPASSQREQRSHAVSPYHVLGLAGSSSRATQAMSITREMPRFLLGVYLVVYLCFGVW
jgi:hypothetical protein